jgi:hypothetical protein
MCTPTTEKFGATPANIQWAVVRGDYASFTVSFKYRSVVAELSFDLQAVIPDGLSTITWTPVIGTICVLGDVSPVSAHYRRSIINDN